MTLPNIGVMPQKFQAGIHNLTDKAPALDMYTFEDTFTKPFPTDAHFVSYQPVGFVDTESRGWPRLNKAVLPKIRSMHGDIVATCLVLDYDSPDKATWTRERLDSWLLHLDQVADEWPAAFQFNVFYTTRHGCRLVYVYDAPVPVDIAEGKHRWMVQEFQRHGINFDPACSDWTRLFRLPYVMRDNTPTWEDDIKQIYLQPDFRLDSDALPSAEGESTAEYGHIRDFDEPKPAPEEAMLVREAYSSETGRYRQSKYYKEARKRLKGRDSYRCIFDGQPIATSGSRDSTIHAYVGQAIGILYYLEGTTPLHIYGLLLPAVEQLEPDGDTPDWTDILWSAIGRLWVKEESKALVKQEEVEVLVAKTQTIQEQIVNGMRQWCKDPLIHDDAQALDFMSAHLICSVGNNYFIMSPTGYYDRQQLLLSQIVPRIRELGMNGLIELKKHNHDGTRMIDKHVSELINEHATIANDIRAMPQVPGSYVDNMGTGNATFVVRSYARNEFIEPQYHDHIDAWLHAMFGEDYDAVANWIGWALAFEEGPICALSIVGAQGSGKKLFCQGLAECLEKPRLATAADLTSDTQYGLVDSPFLVINEGWPQGRARGLHPADQFRALIAGDDFRLNRKFMAPVLANSAVRIIFTANNTDVIHALTGNRNLSPDDRNALGIRLMHVDIGEGGSVWLRSHGGVRFTAVQGNRWIRGDSGEDSNLIIARHFLWLHQQRQGPTGTRFLVEGNARHEIMFEMRTQSGATPLVIETIIHLIEQPTIKQGCVVHKGKLYVLTEAILNYFRDQLSQTTRERLTARIIGGVMKSLVMRETIAAFSIPTRESHGRRRWHEVDCRLLLDVAQRDGWKCAKLEQLIQEQDQRARGVYTEPPTAEELAAQMKLETK